MVFPCPATYLTFLKISPTSFLSPRWPPFPFKSTYWPVTLSWHPSACFSSGTWGSAALRTRRCWPREGRSCRWLWGSIRRRRECLIFRGRWLDKMEGTSLLGLEALLLLAGLLFSHALAFFLFLLVLLAGLLLLLSAHLKFININIKIRFFKEAFTLK